ncbi:MAG: hypothetical protein H6721_24075 [Sandaracinus sp.]|nr:hypothetical protein [Sandaracinus sp.]
MKNRELHERFVEHFARARDHEAQRAELDAELCRLLSEGRRTGRPTTVAARVSLRARNRPLTVPNIQREAARLRKLLSRLKSEGRVTDRHGNNGRDSGPESRSGSSKNSDTIATITSGETIMGPNTSNPSYRRVERTVTVEHFDDELPEDLRGLDEDGDGDDYGPDDGTTDD